MEPPLPHLEPAAAMKPWILRGRRRNAKGRSGGGGVELQRGERSGGGGVELRRGAARARAGRYHRRAGGGVVFVVGMELGRMSGMAMSTIEGVALIQRRGAAAASLIRCRVLWLHPRSQANIQRAGP
ncbi:hypothetical protein VPH35_017161 [Triticum aestivum]